MSNRNAKTGYAYGVLAGNNVPDLVDDIMSSGEDLTHQELREDIKKDLRHRIEGAFADWSARTVVVGAEEDRAAFLAELQAAILNAVDSYTSKPERLLTKGMASALAENETATGIDYEALLAELEAHGLWDYYEEQEHAYAYEYKTGGTGDGQPIKLLLGWLGGAALVWVIDSPFVAYCATCSPCVPGAGDLDTPRDPEQDRGQWAHCLPQDEMPEDWKGHIKPVEAA